MQPRRIAAVALRYFYLVRDSIARLLPIFAWVAVDIVLWGFITKYLGGVVAPGVDLVHTLLGAVLLWDFFARVMTGVTTTFLEDVWSRNFLNVFASPISVGEYVLGLVLSSTVTAIIALLVMLLLASAAFGLSFAILGASAVPALLVLFLFGIAIGVVACALVLRMGPASEWFVWPIPAMLSPFAGVFYPLDTLPGWMQLIGRALPPSYVFDALRAIVAGERPSVAGLGLGLGLSLVYVALASFAFARVYRHAVRTGLLARYSAESVS